MIVEYIRYMVTPESADALIAAYQRASDSLKSSSHCRGFELTRSQEAPSSFILRICWDSLAGHLEGFRTSPEFRSFFEAVQPFVKQIEEMRHYEFTTVKWERES